MPIRQVIRKHVSAQVSRRQLLSQPDCAKQLLKKLYSALEVNILERPFYLSTLDSFEAFLEATEQAQTSTESHICQRKSSKYRLDYVERVAKSDILASIQNVWLQVDCNPNRLKDSTPEKPCGDSQSSKVSRIGIDDTILL